jgi:hypothetical protein
LALCVFAREAKRAVSVHCCGTELWCNGEIFLDEVLLLHVPNRLQKAIPRSNGLCSLVRLKECMRVAISRMRNGERLVVEKRAIQSWYYLLRHTVENDAGECIKVPLPTLVCQISPHPHPSTIRQSRVLQRLWCKPELDVWVQRVGCVVRQFQALRKLRRKARVLSGNN